MSAAVLAKASAGVVKPACDKPGGRPALRCRRNNASNIRTRLPDRVAVEADTNEVQATGAAVCQCLCRQVESPKDEAGIIKQFAAGFSCRLVKSAAAGWADEEDEQDIFEEEETDNEPDSPREPVQLDKFFVTAGGLEASCTLGGEPLFGLLDDEDENDEILFARSLTRHALLNVLDEACSMQEETDDLDDVKQLAIKALDVALCNESEIGFAWEALGCDDYETPSWDELGTRDHAWVPQKTPAPQRLRGLAWESLSNDADDVLSSCVPQQRAVGFAWEALDCDSGETPTWDELGTKESSWIPLKPAARELLPGVAWESLSNDADDLWSACVGKPEVASFAWEALSCDGEHVPSWEQLPSKESSWTPPKPAARELLPGVAWESLSNDADDLWTACVGKPEVASFAWEALSCDGEHIPSWQQLPSKDSAWVAPEPVALERLPGVAWESLGNDTDDVLSACVAKQENPTRQDVQEKRKVVLDIAAPEEKPTNQQKKEKSRPSLDISACEKTEMTPAPTPSKSRRRIIRDIPTRSSPKDTVEVVTELPFSPPMSLKSRARLTGEASLGSLRVDRKALVKEFQASWRQPLAVPPPSSPPAWYAPPSPSQGSAMASDLGLFSGPSSPAPRRQRVASSASTGMLPALPNSMGLKGATKIAPVDGAGKRNRMWNLDRALGVL